MIISSRNLLRCSCKRSDLPLWKVKDCFASRGFEVALAMTGYCCSQWLL